MCGFKTPQGPDVLDSVLGLLPGSDGHHGGGQHVGGPGRPRAGHTHGNFAITNVQIVRHFHQTKIFVLQGTFLAIIVTYITYICYGMMIGSVYLSHASGSVGQ